MTVMRIADPKMRVHSTYERTIDEFGLSKNYTQEGVKDYIYQAFQTSLRSVVGCCWSGPRLSLSEKCGEGGILKHRPLEYEPNETQSRHAMLHTDEEG